MRTGVIVGRDDSPPHTYTVDPPHRLTRVLIRADLYTVDEQDRLTDRMLQISAAAIDAARCVVEHGDVLWSTSLDDVRDYDRGQSR